MKRLVAVIAVFGLVRPAYAVVPMPAQVVYAPNVEWALAAQTQQTAAYFTQNLSNTLALPQILTTVNMSMGILNESAAIARAAFQAYHFVTSEEGRRMLLERAKRGVMQAVPEAAQMQREMRALRQNVRGLRDGTFMQVSTYHDWLASSVLAEHAGYHLRKNLTAVFDEEVVERLREPGSPPEISRAVTMWRARNGTLEADLRETNLQYEWMLRCKQLFDDMKSNPDMLLQANVLAACSELENASNTDTISDYFENEMRVDVERATAFERRQLWMRRLFLDDAFQLDRPLRDSPNGEGP